MRPQFSLVVAIYNVEQYIEAFLASLDRQTYGIADVEVVLVDDGATDSSGQIAERWATTTEAAVTVLHQDNAGQGAARNAGIELATGSWVSFCDPDDILSDNYLEQVALFLAEQKACPDLVACRQLTFTHDPADHVNRHALRSNFKDRDQLVDLGRFPDRIHLSGCSAFFPLDRVREAGVRFDPRIRPTFEDGHFVSSHLMRSPSPLVGFVKTAEYFYRKRADNSSSVQAGWARDEKYTDVPRYGYLDLLERAAQVYDSVPQWLQNTVLYDLLWYFRQDANMTSMTGSISSAALDDFHDLCRQIFRHIDVETVLAFQITPTDAWLKKALILGYKDESLRPEAVVLDELDEAQRLVRVRYLYNGPAPREEFFWRGRPVVPTYGKVRSYEAYGRPIAYERIAWLPLDGMLRVSLDGKPVPLATKGPSILPYSLTTEQLTKALVRRRVSNEPRSASARARVRGLLTGPARGWGRITAWLRSRLDPRRLSADLTRRLADSGFARSRYAEAWVLMDRQDQAQDNAEHLYRYLLRKRPAINAWFVLDRTSADWGRLKREGYRMVAFGSLRWRVLLLNADHVLSSHANGFATNPLPWAYYGPMRWRFTFLQHGVTKDDLSRWLNPKRMHMIITATTDETSSFTADGTSYVFTDREIKHTGFPRHDALLHLAKRIDSNRINYLLVMPTWRRTLTDALPDSLSADEKKEIFRQSDYARQWFGLLRSPEVTKVAADAGLRLAFLPHPNMVTYLNPQDVPAEAELLSWADINVQEVFARSKALVTDYSSVAFDIAMLDRAVIYYQFDQREFFSGAQPFRRGYFDYGRDAFGPVVTEQDQLLVELQDLARRQFEPTAEFKARVSAAFGERAGDACYRVYKAVAALDRPARSRTAERSSMSSLHTGVAPVEDASSRVGRSETTHAASPPLVRARDVANVP